MLKLPHVKVRSVKDYFALDRAEREKWGLYLKPFALPLDWSSFGMDDGEKDQGWVAWSKRIRKEYPIQGFIREWLFDMDNPVYSFLVVRKMRFDDFYYAVKRWFSPQFKRWRKSHSRHQWKEMDTVLVESNFALLLDFWYDEVVDGHVEWSTDKLKEIYDWMKAAVNYIEIQRPAMVASQDTMWPTTNKGTYQELYGKIDALEKEIADKDTELLTKLIEYREYLWT